jgi:phosphoribosyl-AMP cyclohydrolase
VPVAGAGRIWAVSAPAPGLDPVVASRLKRDAAGLLPAVVQQYDTGKVLMVGWMDDEALRRTLTTGRATYWSRSRREYWVKGDTSGHVQWVRSVALDCDGDTVLVQVDQVGPACHTGTASCFDGRALPAAVGSPPGRPGPAHDPDPATATTAGEPDDHR